MIKKTFIFSINNNEDAKIISTQNKLNKNRQDEPERKESTRGPSGKRPNHEEIEQGPNWGK